MKQLLEQKMEELSGKLIRKDETIAELENILKKKSFSFTEAI
jgi:hypothetical protein